MIETGSGGGVKPVLSKGSLSLVRGHQVTGIGDETHPDRLFGVLDGVVLAFENDVTHHVRGQCVGLAVDVLADCVRVLTCLAVDDLLGQAQSG